MIIYNHQKYNLPRSGRKPDARNALAQSPSATPVPLIFSIISPVPLASHRVSCYICLMTITKTVEVPANRWLAIEVPSEVPAGAIAQVKLKIVPFAEKGEKLAAVEPSKLRLARRELDEILRNAQTPISDSLTGILAHLGDITAEQIRDERLAKHFQ